MIKNVVIFDVVNKKWTVTWIKSRTITLQKSCFYSFQWRPFKNGEFFLFNFMLKGPFIYEIFLCWLLSYTEKWLDKKTKVNFRIYVVTDCRHRLSGFMPSQTGKQIFCLILKKYSNKAIKLGKLIEHNMRNIFLEKSCIHCSGNASPSLFYKISKLSISLDQPFEMF